MIRRVTVSLFACVALLGTAACKSETTPPVEAPQTTAGAPEGQFTASDTFGVLRALHTAEVEHGTMAQKKANDPRVRAFAEKVVNDHKARMQKDNQIMSGLDIQPRDSQISEQVKSAASAQTSRLESMSGADFDRAYLEEQVNYYRMVLDTLDKNLIPNARDTQVRASLQNARQKANDHLREAQDLRNSISMATPPGTTP